MRRVVEPGRTPDFTLARRARPSARGTLATRRRSEWNCRPVGLFQGDAAILRAKSSVVPNCDRLWKHELDSNRNQK